VCKQISQGQGKGSGGNGGLKMGVEIEGIVIHPIFHLASVS